MKFKDEDESSERVKELTLSVGSVFDKTKLLYKHHMMQLVPLHVSMYMYMLYMYIHV